MTKPVGAARPLKAEPPPFPPPAPLPSARDAGRATRGGARRQARTAVGWAGGACRVAVVMGRKWLLRRAPFSNRRRGRAGPGLLPQNRPLPMRSDRGERGLARLPLGSLFLRALPMPRWHVSASPPWFALEEFTFSSVSVRLSRREAGVERSKGWAGGRRAGRWPRGVRVPLCAYTAWCLVARRPDPAARAFCVCKRGRYRRRGMLIGLSSGCTEAALPFLHAFCISRKPCFPDGEVIEGFVTW